MQFYKQQLKEILQQIFINKLAKTIFTKSMTYSYSVLMFQSQEPEVSKQNKKYHIKKLMSKTMVLIHNKLISVQKRQLSDAFSCLLFTPFSIIETKILTRQLNNAAKKYFNFIYQ